MYLFYSDTARTWTGASSVADRQLELSKIAFAQAVEDYFDRPRRLLGDFVAFWRESEALIIPSAVLRPQLEMFATLDPEIQIRLVPAKAPREASATLQPLDDRDLPWIVEATAADPTHLFAGADQRRRVYMSILLFVFALLLVGTFVTARAIQRELAVARMMNDFVAAVSHEFRSPLTAIRQLSEMLQRGRAPSEAKRQEYYALIHRESDRLSRLVENLLDFSRIEEGRKQYNLETVQTADWLREVAGRYESANVTLSLPPQLPAITCDRVALTSAVDNLLDNAIKYSPPGAVVLCEAEARGRELIICVRDRGYGIPEHDREHIFEKFYRGSGEISQRVKGAGVGLSLVREIVHAHGGTIEFDSRIGEGTVFRVRLKSI